MVNSSSSAEGLPADNLGSSDNHNLDASYRASTDAETGNAGKAGRLEKPRGLGGVISSLSDEFRIARDHVLRPLPAGKNDGKSHQVHEGDPMLAAAGNGESQPATASPEIISTEVLLEEFHGTVFSYAYRLTGNTSAADDIAQEVFVRAFRNAGQLRDLKAARGWLLVITRNEFSRWCRKFRPFTSPGNDYACDAQPRSHCPAIDNAEWVHLALEQLPADYRLAITMFYFEQLSYAEIADKLAIPIGTVMSRLNRARSFLKESLSRLAEPNSTRSSS